MKLLWLFVLVLSYVLPLNAQNVVLGTNGFAVQVPATTFKGFGFGTRMGVNLFNSEIGIKTFYGKTSTESSGFYLENEAYGVSLYAFVPLAKMNKFGFYVHAEGGASLLYNNFAGSERAIQMGIGPAIKYRLRPYIHLELIVEYGVMTAITSDSPVFNSLVVPTIGWSVTI